MILPCTCENKFQDERYGKSMRVHNACNVKGTTAGKGWRCTACLNEKKAAG